MTDSQTGNERSLRTRVVADVIHVGAHKPEDAPLFESTSVHCIECLSVAGTVLEYLEADTRAGPTPADLARDPEVRRAVMYEFASWCKNHPDNAEPLEWAGACFLISDHPPITTEGGSDE